MYRLIDFLTFRTLKAKQVALERPGDAPDDRPRKGERDLAILAGKYPAEGAEIEPVSEYRLASLLQYPHY